MICRIFLLLAACMGLAAAPAAARAQAADSPAADVKTSASPTAAAPRRPAPPPPPAAPGIAPLPPAALEAFADGVITEAMDREHIVGVAVSVVQNGQVILSKGYGAASLAPLRRVEPEATLFRIGSISKTFTWIALMREVEAGRIRIDGPINLYLPETLQVRDQGYRAPVRVVNLMDHSAGFEDRTLGQLFERNVARERTLADYLRQERPRRVHPPGEISSYSNYGAALAGEAVSYVTGQPFETLIENEILRPGGLTRTTFREARPPKAGLPAPMPAELARNLSEGFRWTGGGYAVRPYELLGHIAPAGSASSTAGDMGRYMLLLLRDGQTPAGPIYGPAAARAFRTPLRPTPPGINGWLHGFVAYTLPGDRPAFGHEGATLSFMSRMVVVPGLDLGVFITANTETGEALTRRFADRLVAQFYGPAQIFPRPGVQALRAEAGQYEGQYLGSRRAYGGLEAFINRPTLMATVKVTEDGRLLTRTAEDGVQTWVPEGDPGRGRFISATGYERLAFALDGGRRAESFKTSSNLMTYQRAGFWNTPGALLAAACLTLLCAAATLAGVFLRNRREFRETTIQGRASLVQNIQAVLWFAGLALFGLWSVKLADVARVMYDWPGLELIMASACALVAAALTVTTAVILPAVWRGGRRLDSWTGWRKAGFTLTVLVYLAFTVLLGVWGGLAPWAG